MSNVDHVRAVSALQDCHNRREYVCSDATRVRQNVLARYTKRLTRRGSPGAVKATTTVWDLQPTDTSLGRSTIIVESMKSWTSVGFR